MCAQILFLHYALQCAFCMQLMLLLTMIQGNGHGRPACRACKCTEYAFLCAECQRRGVSDIISCNYTAPLTLSLPDTRQPLNVGHLQLCNTRDLRYNFAPIALREPVSGALIPPESDDDQYDPVRIVNHPALGRVVLKFSRHSATLVSLMPFVTVESQHNI